jgi:hypothetical protein
LGHVYGEYTVEVAPTRTTEGNLFAVCSRDNTHKDIVVLPKLSTTNGYLYEVIVPATDISDGKGRFAFVRNGNTYYFDVIITANETEFDPR